MKTVILYATKYGSTEEVARRLREQLDGEVDLVNVVMDSFHAPVSYDTVILGGSVYMGKIQKQLTNYIRKNIDVLEQKRIGLFICAAHPEEKKRIIELQQAFPTSLNQRATAKAVLGYTINFDKMSFIDKFIMRKIKGDNKNVAEFYDDRIKSFSASFRNMA
ncbi:flavodoxin domain-containing protein [Sporolactobacillus nakayamae]|uniref:Menaquinone-dependent protoporphyrinogen oxidase n=1 Tax=Sporolactobacillus nakayamae TaxID=269670 RepID=A0A1I2V9S8_9BACL|nr:flavodoxin domain-containing protein [Sporolactobacillus nakayamae]SFG84156.1 menaquinone-dependent protoporphyrinogen oxidase [Sporolactobacillus nakayamae]